MKLIISVAGLATFGRANRVAGLTGAAWTAIDMDHTNLNMVCSRTIPFIDADTLALREEREALFRDPHGFLLYLSKDISSAPGDERSFRVGVREALLWLNEDTNEQGSFWA